MSQKDISLNKLIEHLFNVPAPPAPMKPDTKSPKEQTTIRFDKSAEHFFSFHAERLGISMQQMMGLTLSAIAETSRSPEKAVLELAGDRFREVFSAHHIPQIHINNIINSHGENNFPLSAVADNRLLLEKYTPQVKDTISRLFSVKTDWLNGERTDAVAFNPICSRDFCHSVWHNLLNPIQLANITPDNRTLLCVKSDRDQGFDVDDCNLPIPLEVLLVSTIDWQLDRGLRFTTFNLEGILPMTSKETRIGLSGLLNAIKSPKGIESNIMTQGVTYPFDTVMRLKRGQLPVTCLRACFPSMWSTDSLLTHNDPDVEMLSELLASSV